MTWGVVFDWDGVIIDSSKHHEESWNRLARETDRPLPPGHFKRGFGMKNRFIIPEILQWTDDPAIIDEIAAHKERLYRQVVKERGIEPLPGVEPFLNALAGAGIPCAIGSSTDRENIEMALDLIGLRGHFRAIVSAEDVTRGKPAPDVFLKAAEKLGIPPGRIVVIEDAHVGIEAARNAKMRVIAVATTNSLAELNNADLAVERLDLLEVEKIASWFSS